MSGQAQGDLVIDQLEVALAEGALPAAAQDHARQILKRLTQPVRVTLMGLPGSGKSMLLNMLLGRELLTGALPTVEVTWGLTEKTVLTTQGGKTMTRRGLDFELVAEQQPAFVRIELPLPILQRIHLLEVVTDGDATELQSAIDWSVRRTDIAIWCSQAFDTEERRLWARVPDGVKDHAFLALTKADVLTSKKLLSARIAELEAVVAEEFHSLFPVATRQALKAQTSGKVDETVYKASGGAALADEVLRHAERGRRADFDSAHLFLARYQIKPDSARMAEYRRRRVSALRREVEAAAAPADAAASVPASEPAAAAKPKTAAPRPAATPAPVANPDLMAEASRFLRRRGEGLAEAAGDDARNAGAGVVGQCASAVEHLIGLFSQDDSGCAAADAMLDELTEAEEMLVLMQSESGQAPAADAVTLLLQLKREMDMTLAA